MIEWKEFDDPARAEVELLRDLAAAPGNARLHFSLAEVYVFTRNCAKAIQHCRKALELDSEHKPLYYEFLAHTCQRAEDYATSILWLDQLTRLPDPESQHFIDLFEVNMLIGAAFEASDVLDRMRRHVPQSVIDECRTRVKAYFSPDSRKAYRISIYASEGRGLASYAPFKFDAIEEVILHLKHARKWRFVTRGYMDRFEDKYVEQLDKTIPVAALTLEYLAGDDVTISESREYYCNQAPKPQSGNGRVCP